MNTEQLEEGNQDTVHPVEKEGYWLDDKTYVEYDKPKPPDKQMVEKILNTMCFACGCPEVNYDYDDPNWKPENIKCKRCEGFNKAVQQILELVGKEK